MARRRVNIKRQAAALFFLLLFTTYYSNATLFGHSHVIGGVTIVHSHFHTQSHHATPSGAHPAAQITLIALLNTVNCTDAAVAEFDFSPEMYLIRSITAASVAQCVLPVSELFLLRAPPASV